MGNRKGGSGGGLSRENNFSGGGACRRGAAHFLSSAYKGGGGGGGGGGGPVIEAASAVTLRMGFTLLFNFADTVIPIGTYMDATAALWSKFDYDDWAAGVHIHTDLSCGCGVRVLCGAQSFGARPAQGANLRNAAGFFPPASWNDLTNPHRMKVKLLYTVPLSGISTPTQRMTWHSGGIDYSGSMLADTAENISVRGLNQQHISSLGYNVFRMVASQGVTGYSFTANIEAGAGELNVFRREVEASDLTWLADPITW